MPWLLVDSVTTMAPPALAIHGADQGVDDEIGPDANRRRPNVVEFVRLDKRAGPVSFGDDVKEAGRRLRRYRDRGRARCWTRRRQGRGRLSSQGADHRS